MPSDLDVPVTAKEAASLRQQYYNAEIVHRRDVHDELAIFRVRPDGGIPPYAPGQYVALGLGNWEPRLEGTQAETLSAKEQRKLVRRAYSICCPMLNDRGQLAPCSEIDFLEFYVTLVRHNPGKPPGLTPRLFCSQPGDRVWLARKIVGTYTLRGIEPEEPVIFFGTGTGEAPHNAMAAELLAHKHQGPVVVATCVRAEADLGYRATHEAVAEKHANYRYLTYTTREPHNVDPEVAGYIGKQHLQDEVISGRFEAETGVQLDPTRVHVFLCGNPAMIGFVSPGSKAPHKPGLLQVLEARGFRPDGDPGPGLVRFEKYW